MLRLDVKERIASAVDLRLPQQYIAAGFDVNFVGPHDLLEGLTSEDVGGGDGVSGAPGEERDNLSYVDEETFCLWLDSTEFTVGLEVQKWWAGLVACEEDDVGALKMGDDETTVDLYWRIVSCEEERQKEDTRKAESCEAEPSQDRPDSDDRDTARVLKTCEPRGVKEAVLTVSALVKWLQVRMGDGLRLGISPELVFDDVIHELEIARRLKGLDDDKACIREPENERDVEEDALRTAERLVYGWPSREADPTGAYSYGRFAKAFPLDFPMGIGDLHEERPRKVSPEVWVQHLLRYRTGHFAGGPRKQRVLWALVNVLLLSEARGRGYAIFRNVVRRTGLGLTGGRVPVSYTHLTLPTKA